MLLCEAMRRWIAIGMLVPAFAQAQPKSDDDDQDEDGDEEPADPPEGEPGEGEGKPATPATTTILTGTVDAPELEAPLAGATVSIVGTNLSTTTDADGKFVLDVPPGKVKVRVEFAGFKTQETDLVIVLGDPIETNVSMAPDQGLNEVIVVVGSRTPRTNVETPVAVDVVSAEEIARVGRAETGRILDKLAPSFISTPQTIADGSDHVDPAALRGLGPDQVLVLINGKRRHKSALLHVNGTFGRGTVGTDLNAIAPGSIKRIEILRDGAASQYGSDAIAGVINIVTKDVTDLVEVDTMSGVTGSGDGAQVKTSANYGFKIGEKGFLNLTGEFMQRARTDRSGTYTGTVYTSDKTLDDQLLAMNGVSRGDLKMRIGESAATLAIGSYNLELPFGNTAKFYSFGDLSARDGQAAGFYRFPRQATQNVAEFYRDGFLPQIHSRINDVAVTAGLKRKGTWDVDVSLTHGRNNFGFNVERSVNASLGTASPLTFNGGDLQFQQTVGNLDLLHKVDTKAVKSLSVVLGSEYRVENYQITRGDEASYVLGPTTLPDGTPKAAGAQVFPGFQPSNEVDRTRNNIGLYAGIESAISKKFTLDAGGRFEKYSDFGTSLIGKVATRYELVKGVAIRAAGSTGFRAPSLQQLWFSNVSTQFVAGPGGLQPNQVLTSNNASPVTKQFGIPQLNEEKSVNASAGLTLRPLENLSLTLDGYYIHLRDRIVLTSQFSSVMSATNSAEVAGIVGEILDPFPGISAAQFFANAVDTQTFGADLVLDWVADVGTGSLTTTASLNLSNTKVLDVKIPKSLSDRFSGVSDQLENLYFGRLARNRLEDSVPRQKGTAATRYSYEGITAMLRANYYGSVVFKPDDAMNDEVFGAKVLFDVLFGYQFSKNVMLSVGADNLFNTFPDRQTKAANISDGRFVYSRNVSQFGQNGGFYYGKLELTFF